jgi:nucleotide-binding universal stress UspA family protein
MVILAAIDENERSKIVAKIASDLAVTYNDTLVALHVMPKDEFKSHKKNLQSIPEFSNYSITQEAESAARFARDFILETVDNIDPQQLETRGRVGKITEEILAEASSLEPRFLVISGRRRSPTGKAVFGNTAQQLLLNSECPVVVQFDRGGTV